MLLQPAEVVCEAAQEAAKAAIRAGDLAGHERITIAMRLLAEGHALAFGCVAKTLRDATNKLQPKGQQDPVNKHQAGGELAPAAELPDAAAGSELPDQVRGEMLGQRLTSLLRMAIDCLGRAADNADEVADYTVCRDYAHKQILKSLNFTWDACCILRECGSDMDMDEDTLSAGLRLVGATAKSDESPKGGA